MTELPGRNEPLSIVSCKARGDEYSGAPNENIIQNHLNIALLNVF